MTPRKRLESSTACRGEWGKPNRRLGQSSRALRRGSHLSSSTRADPGSPSPVPEPGWRPAAEGTVVKQEGQGAVDHSAALPALCLSFPTANQMVFHRWAPGVLATLTFWDPEDGHSTDEGVLCEAETLPMLHPSSRVTLKASHAPAFPGTGCEALTLFLLSMHEPDTVPRALPREVGR